MLETLLIRSVVVRGRAVEIGLETTKPPKW